MFIIVKIKMEEDSKPKQKRIRLKPSHRWTDSQTLQLLQAVSDVVRENPESFEKPTAQRFYEKLQHNTSALQSVPWLAMKSKMRYLKASYVAAAGWKNKTGSGLLANGGESSVLMYINKTCPHFNLLEEIFGLRRNVNPTVIFESTDNIEVLADSPCADSYLNDTIECYELCSFESEDLVDPVLPNSSHCSAAAATSTPLGSSNFRSSTKKQPKRIGEAPFDKLLLIQEKRLELEVTKIELEKEKEKNEVELKKIELKNQLEMKKIETESERETKLEIEKLKLASEEKMKMFEIELKLKSK